MPERIHHALGVLILGLLAAVGAPAAARQSPVALPASETHLLESEKVGDSFRVDVALPLSYSSGEASYPVVYALDADLMFAGIAETARLAAFGAEMPEVIVVGQGYPDPAQDRVLFLRTRDYTPIADKVTDERLAERSPALAGRFGSGGAPRFLEFLREELIPFVEARYRTAGPRVFVGDSFGGLFGLYALFEAPDTFDRWLIGSPSIWFGDEVTLAAEEAFAAKHRDLPERVFFSVGFLEEIPGDSATEGARMVSNTRKVHHRLVGREYPSLETELVIFDDETHLSVVPAAISRGLRWLLRD